MRSPVDEGFDVGRWPGLEKTLNGSIAICGRVATLSSQVRLTYGLARTHDGERDHWDHLTWNYPKQQWDPAQASGNGRDLLQLLRLFSSAAPYARKITAVCTQSAPGPPAWLGRAKPTLRVK